MGGAFKFAPPIRFFALVGLVEGFTKRVYNEKRLAHFICRIRQTSGGQIYE